MFYQVCNHLKFVQLDVIIMQLYVTKCDYDVTRCNIIILGFFEA
jgi:hypothetical protein